MKAILSALGDCYDLKLAKMLIAVLKMNLLCYLGSK